MTGAMSCDTHLRYHQLHPHPTQYCHASMGVTRGLGRNQSCLVSQADTDLSCAGWHVAEVDVGPEDSCSQPPRDNVQDWLGRNAPLRGLPEIIMYKNSRESLASRSFLHHRGAVDILLLFLLSWTIRQSQEVFGAMSLKH